MNEQRIPETLQPAPEPLEKGWHNVATVGDVAVDIHDKHTVVASVVASAATTLLYLAAQERVPMGANFDLSSDTTRRVVDTVSTYHNHEERLVTSTQKRVSEQIVPVTDHKTESVQVVMPDVAHFELGKDQRAQHILNPDQVSHLFGTLDADKQDGWKITSAHVEGMASDEYRAAPNAGIGAKEPANQKIAEQYGAFVKKAVVDSLQSDGVVIPTTMEAHEVPVDVRGQAWIAGASKELGLTTKQLIDQYKKDPASLKAEVRAQLDIQLGANRGGKVTFDLERTTLAEQAEYLGEDVTRCVDGIQTIITTKAVNSHSEALLPIGIIPFPLLRPRRKKFIEGEIVEPEDTPEPETVKPVQPETPKDAEPAGLALGVGAVRAGVYPKKYSFPEGELPTLTEEEQQVAYEARKAARERRERNINIAAGIAAGVAVVALSGIRFDAGYCPDPSDYRNQSFDISKGLFPDSLHAYWNLPFTDIRTDDMLLVPANCTPDPRAPLGTDYQPTCDVVDETVQDGKMVEQTETNYPGALHTRKYTVAVK
jgi:hypothetical protein